MALFSLHRLASLLGCLVISTEALADEATRYGYFDGHAMALGRGIDEGYLTVGKFPCIEFKPRRIDQGAPETRMHIDYVSSLSQLEQIRGVDISAKASGWGNSVEGSMSKAYRAKTEANSAIIVVTANSNYGRWDMEPGAQLSGSSATFQDPDAFIKKCGSSYVSLEWRGASASAIIKIDGLSSETRDAIKTTFGAKGGYGAVSGEMKGKIENEIKSANKTQRVSVEVVAFAGLGMGSLGDIVKNSISSSDSPLTSIGESLSKFVNSFSAENAVGTHFQIRSMTDFGLPSEALMPWRREKESRLQTYIDNYILMQADSEVVESFINGSHPMSANSHDLMGTAELERGRLSNVMTNTKSYYDACKLVASGDDCEKVAPYQAGLVSSTINRGPSLSFYIPQLTSQQTRAVLSEDETHRASVASEFNRLVGSSGRWAATLRFAGYKLTIVEFFFRFDEDGHTLSFVSPIRANINVVWTSSHEDVLPGVNKMESLLKEWLSTSNGSFSGEVFVRVSDEGNRTFDLPLGHVRYAAADGKLTSYRMDID